MCSKRTNPKERRCVDKNIPKYLRKKFLIERKETSFICSKCRSGYYREPYEELCFIPLKDLPKFHATSFSSETSENRNRLASPSSVSMALKSTVKTHAYCIACKKAGTKLVVVSQECRTAMFVEHNVKIPSGNRCCPAHTKDGRFKSEAICQLPTTEHILVNRTATVGLL